MKSTRCFFGFHRWKLHNTDGDRIPGNWLRTKKVPHECVIYRKCECCGVMEW